MAAINQDLPDVAPLVQLLVDSAACAIVLRDAGLPTSVKTQIATRPLLVTTSQPLSHATSCVVATFSDCAVPPVGSTATVFKTYLAALAVRLYELIPIRNGFFSVTEIGTQTGGLPFVPAAAATVPMLLPPVLVNETLVSVVSNTQLTLGGVPGFEPIPPPQVAPINPMADLPPLLVPAAPDAAVVQRLAVIALIQTQFPDMVFAPMDIVAFVSGHAALPPLAGVPPPVVQVVAPALTPAQGITSQRVRMSVSTGFLSPPIAASFGTPVVASVVASVVKQSMRTMPTATGASVNLITETDCMNLCTVSNWSPDLAHKFLLACCSARQRDSSDAGDFLALRTFLDLAEKISLQSAETVPALRAVFEFLRRLPDAAYVSKVQLIGIFFDNIVTIYDAAFATISAAPNVQHGHLFRDDLLQAVIVPDALKVSLSEVRLANSDRDAALVLERQTAHETRMSAIEKRARGTVPNVPRVPVSGVATAAGSAGSIPSVPLDRPFPCHRWLNNEPCAGNCGFYHSWPGTVTEVQKGVFLAAAANRTRRPRGTSGSPAGSAAALPLPVVPVP